MRRVAVELPDGRVIEARVSGGVAETLLAETVLDRVALEALVYGLDGWLLEEYARGELRRALDDALVDLRVERAG